MLNPKSGCICIKKIYVFLVTVFFFLQMRIHPNPSHSDYVSYIKRDILFPQILPRDLIIVNVEIDVAVETITTTTEPIMVSFVSVVHVYFKQKKRVLSSLALKTKWDRIRREE